MYIALEGIDTAGKTTQIELLKRKYPKAIITKEPGATALGEKIREIVLYEEFHSELAEMFLFLADRAEHIARVIQPNREKIIISDRSLVSGIAYAKNIPLQNAIPLNLIATNKILPTHLIILELSAKELSKRLDLKDKDTIESRGIEYLLDIQSRLKETAELLEINTIVIDAGLSVEEIADKINMFIGMN